MAFEKPEYPEALTRKNWDKNKGVLAKMAGFTGMGDALAKLEAQYKKVDWKLFDLEVKFPRGDKNFTLTKLEDAVVDAVKEVKNGECAKLRTEAFSVRDLAAKTEKDYKANKLIPKTTTALCASIGKAADLLGVTVNANSMADRIQKSAKDVRSLYDLTVDNIEKNFHGHVSKLEKAFVPVVKEPTDEMWRNAGIMTLARNLNQQIGNVEKLVLMGYNVGMNVSDCTAFFKDMTPYASKAVPFEKDASESDRKEHAKKMLLLLKRAKALKS
jgi:hypothetical protein